MITHRSCYTTPSIVRESTKFSKAFNLLSNPVPLRLHASLNVPFPASLGQRQRAIRLKAFTGFVDPLTPMGLLRYLRPGASIRWRITCRERK